MRQTNKYSPRQSLVSLGLALIAFVLTANGDKTAARQGSKPSIQYTVVSQRLLTHEELSRFEDVKGYKIAIRLRLRNESDRDVEYLASSLNVRPLGYSWQRKRGKKDWGFNTPSRGRDGPPGSEFTGIGYTWRVLPAYSAVEAETLSYTAKDEEFAFSTFVRNSAQSEMKEIVSDVVRPLFDR